MMTVGIAGIAHAVGTTHFSVLTALYLAEVRGFRTALVGWNPGDAFRKMGDVYGQRKAGKTHDFAPEMYRLREADVYTDADAKLMIRLKEAGYAFCVIDFGVFRAEIHDEFFRSGRKFLVASGSRWQIADLAEFASKAQPAGTEYVASFGGNRSLDLAERYLGIRIGRIPPSFDPGVIDGSLMTFFGNLWRENPD